MSTHEPIALPTASQAQLRSARRLLRRKERSARRMFIAEGPQTVREALVTPDRVQLLLVTEQAAARHPELLQSAIDTQVVTVELAEADLRSVTDSATPQGILAICSMIDYDLEQVLAGRPRLIVCCDEIRDPGNAGTVVRCADAAGADAVIFSRASVDLYNPKTVRATTGSLFHLPIIADAELGSMVERCRSRGMQVLATAGGGEADLAELSSSGELARPTVWLMGNEARGLDRHRLRLADRSVAVPIYGRAESLNLSTAAAVCLYASAFAQRS